MKRGHKISKIANLNRKSLLALFAETSESENLATQDKPSPHVYEALELMALQKWAELFELFRNLKARDSGQLVREFFLPVIAEFNSRVRRGLVSIAQEHVFSSLLKEKIYAVATQLNSQQEKSSKRVRFVLAAPEGDFHEIGLLLAHLLIRTHGLTSLYLGPHTPAQELSETALRFEATHLLLVATIAKNQGANQELLSYVAAIQKRVGTQLPILLAGNQAHGIAAKSDTAVQYIPSFDDFNRFLKDVAMRRQA